VNILGGLEFGTFEILCLEIMTFLGTFDVGPICLSLFEVGLYYLWFSFTALLRCTLASGVNSSFYYHSVILSLTCSCLQEIWFLWRHKLCIVADVSVN